MNRQFTEEKTFTSNKHTWSSSTLIVIRDRSSIGKQFPTHPFGSILKVWWPDTWLRTQRDTGTRGHGASAGEVPKSLGVRSPDCAPPWRPAREQGNPRTMVFTAALFANAPKRDDLNVYERIIKWRYIYTVQSYTAVKISQPVSQVSPNLDLTTIIRNETEL